MKQTLRAGAGWLVSRASRNYIAGPSTDDAQRVSAILASRGYSVTQGYWDSPRDARELILQACLTAVENLAALPGDNYLSLKIPSLDYDDSAFGRLREHCRDHDVALHFDSLAPEHADRIWSFLTRHEALLGDDVGCTLPGRWPRSVDDVDIVTRLGLDVRVVKGQWLDPEAPDHDARQGCLDVVGRLAGTVSNVRVATHDYELASESIRRLKRAGSDCELELLYGLPIDRLAALAVSTDTPVRFYVAFGHAYLPYALGSLRRNPRMILPLARAALKRNYLASVPDIKTTHSLSTSQN